MPTSTTRRGGTIPELLAGLAALALLAALVIPGAARMRGEARTASSLSQLRWIAGVTSSYAADFNDRMWGLNWQAGDLPHSDPGLPPSAFSGLDAIATQAVDLMRRRGRPDMPRFTSWYAPVHYSHLPLLDYLDRDMPDFNFVSPEDKYRLQWARDPEGFDRGEYLPYQPSSIPTRMKWPYSASYQIPAAMISDPVSGSDAVRQGQSQWNFVAAAEASFRGALMSSVTFPAQKVLLHAAASWQGRPRYFADPAAKPALLGADGATHIHPTAATNMGWHPQFPTSSTTTMQYTYNPRAWEPPTPSGGVAEFLTGYYRWTRGGPAGRDFGGPEVDTGQ